ncbi:MAG: DUF58 domain-containing protein [Lachnospiraceae bacterium]|nr:DUF58 domain-containing protein [Lachnospiraceae bacterium]
MIQIIGIGIIGFLLFSLQQKIYQKLWNKNLTATIHFASSGIFEGQKGQLKEVIENRKRLPLSMVKVKFQTDRHLLFDTGNGSRTTDLYYRNDIFQMNGMEKLTRTISFIGGQRGYYSICSMDLVSTDLFMTRQFVETMPVHTTLYVYPRPFDSREFRHSLQQLNGEVLTRRHLLEDPFEYRGIREYQPTDDMRSINWKATAKTGDFKVNQKNYTALQAIRIYMNLQDDGILKKEEGVEASIRIAAGLCEFFLGQGIRVSCYGNGCDMLHAHPMSIEASSGKGQMESIYKSLARIDTSKPVCDFTASFGKRLLEEAKGTITCFVAPNHYPDFLKLLEQYDSMGSEYIWFYPLVESHEPELPAFLKRKVRFLPVREMNLQGMIQL